MQEEACMCSSQPATSMYQLVDHRPECNEEERERIASSGGEVGRLNAGCGVEVDFDYNSREELKRFQLLDLIWVASFLESRWLYKLAFFPHCPPDLPLGNVIACLLLLEMEC